jgi:hydrogenase nickel incorporation protein HypB
MCTTCGCGEGETTIDSKGLHSHEHVHADGTVHSHAHDDDHGHDHSHQDHAHSHAYVPAHSRMPGPARGRMVSVEQDILAKNNAYAAANRQRFAERGIFALNLVSSPGSGKTTLLCKTIAALAGKRQVAVVEGDQQTSNDAERIRATGAPAIQINTGKGCHLDAHMVGHALDQLLGGDGSLQRNAPGRPKRFSAPWGEGAAEQRLRGGLLMIENVGNLVCPAAFDLGEAHKVVILSVTEGEDKPLKYPDMFKAADLMLLNKCDLLPHLSFDADLAVEYARRINPAIRVIRTSATSGEGISEWLEWIEKGVASALK